MYLREGQERAPAPGEAPPQAPSEVNWLLARPLLPNYRLASGWAEVAYEWSTADLHHAHLICDAIDAAQPQK